MKHELNRAAVIMIGVVACAPPSQQSASGRAAGGVATSAEATNALPPSGDSALARLRVSPRHGEWVTIRTGVGDSVRAWIVYPERSTPAPVVVVIHENTGLIPWTRAVADQLAAEGFLAIAPDLLTMSNLRGSPDSVDTQAALAAVATLRPDVMQRQIDSVAQYAMRLPSAVPSYGIIGFCWGGGVTFRYATHSPTLRAAVVFYGPTPPIDLLSGVHAPVLGLYGGSDARIDAGVPATDSAMRKLGKTFEPHFFEGAGHAFMRLQNGMNGANAKAAAQAWPQMLKWLRTYVGR